MLYYSIADIAERFSLSRTRMAQLSAKGRGPRRSPNGKVTTEEALTWAEQRIEALSSRVETEKDADRYVRGAQRIRVEAFISQARTQNPKTYTSAARVRVKRKGPGYTPHDIVPVGLPDLSR